MDIFEKLGKFDYSSTQINLPPDIASKIRNAANKISPEDLSHDPDASPGGKEKDPHITVLYGLHTNNPSKISDALSGSKPVKLELGKLSLFENGNFDVLKVDVDSKDLHDLNSRLSSDLSHTKTHKSYNPHATVAYLKKGKGQKYLDLLNFNNEQITADTVHFSDKSGNKTPISLKRNTGEKKMASFMEKLAADIEREAAAKLNNLSEKTATPSFKTLADLNPALALRLAKDPNLMANLQASRASTGSAPTFTPGSGPTYGSSRSPVEPPLKLRQESAPFISAEQFTRRKNLSMPKTLLKSPSSRIGDIAAELGRLGKFFKR